jgi:two-component system, NtrC family, response regulator AtoC
VIEIVAVSDAMRETVRLAGRVAETDANVLVTGESGAGKDALAFFIHAHSQRAHGAFVKIDCATLPADLLEAELFGYERGAFTGATEDKPGRLEAAHRGTIVLDEIAYLTVESQAKLLRVIETKEFERLGGRRTIRVDARLIALTNVELAEAVNRKQFREDLYYRLNVVQLLVPPLRDRRQDLPGLIDVLLHQYAAKHGRAANRFSGAALALMHAYDFPGNVRELANTVERAVIMSSGSQIDTEHLPESIHAAASVKHRQVEPPTLAQVEAEYVDEVLAAAKGNKTEAARILGISRKNLYEKLAKKQRTKADG